jgi:hypothetical protein
MPEKKDKQIELTKQLTDHFAIDLGDSNPELVNAEVEEDEWLMYPDGNIQKGYGEKHSEGGIDVRLPNNTKIISDAIPMGAKNAKSISKKFGVKVSAKDTFAKAMEKYSKKIGLNKVTEEQEEYFEELKKQSKSDIDDSTALVNNEFLSAKINELEKRKKVLRGELGSFFNVVFEEQENKKAQSPEKYNNNDGEAMYGGVSESDLSIIANRMGMPLDQVIDIHTGRKKKKPVKFKLGGIKKYAPGGESNGDDDGGPKDVRGFRRERRKLREQRAKGGLTTLEYIEKSTELGEKYGISYDQDLDAIESDNSFTELSFDLQKSQNKIADQLNIDVTGIGHQSMEGTAFRKIGREGPQSTFEEIKNQFPAVWNNVAKGKTPVEVAESFDNKNKGDKDFVKKLQKGMNKEMKEMGQYVIDNEDLFSEDEVEFANKYLEEETFVGEEIDDVRATEGKLGEWTATRRALEVDLVTPEERKRLPEGVFTARDIKKNSEYYNSLSDESKSKVDVLGDDAPGFKINTYEPVEPEPEAKEKVVPEDPRGIVPEDVQRNTSNTFYPYHVPSAIPMQPQLAQQVTLNRIDPFRLRYEEDHQALRQGMERTERSGSTPQTQLAVNASMVAGQQKADAAGQMQAVMATAQNYAQADQSNAKVGDRERTMNTQLAKNYFDEVSGSLNAKRLNEEERRLFMHRQGLEHYDQNRMNAIYQELFDYNPGYFSTVEYDPAGRWEVEDRSDRFSVIGPPTGSQSSKKSKGGKS